MNEKVKPYLEKVKGALGKVSKKIWILLAVLVIVAVAVTVVLTTWGSDDYTVLFTDLSSSDMSAILTYLEEQGYTDCQVKDNDTILVPSGQENKLKAKVLQQGYPTSGFAYDYNSYFNNVSALSTESERNTAALIALQEHISAVVACFDGVKDATVLINEGEDRSYVLDSGNVIEASASVTVSMRDGKTLTKDQAAAIRNLVARSVKGLEVSSVEVVDTYGNRYTDSTSSASDSEASALKLQLEEENNTKIRTEIMQVLEPIFGADNVKVAVNCTVELSYLVQQSTDVTTPESGTVIGSMVYDKYVSREDDETTAGGVVGTSDNSDLDTYVDTELNDVSGSTVSASSSGQVDYENSKTETYVERTAGYLTDCTVSVSINSDSVSGTLDVDAIRTHIARAAGLSAVSTETMTEEEYLASKISVLAMPFYEEEIEPILPAVVEELPEWAIYAVAGALLLLLILLVVIILLIVRNRKHKKAHALQNMKNRRDRDALNAALLKLQQEREELEDLGADVMAMHSEKSMELRKDIREFADTNPEIAAQMIRLWLKGGEEDG